ncbi:hypothetical protein KI387_003022, partial [Taxus chinensis]
PFDILITKLIAQGTLVDPRQVGYHGHFHALRTVYAQDGLLALLKRLLPKLMKIPPGQVIMR